jgi:hypothetical protein
VRQAAPPAVGGRDASAGRHAAGWYRSAPEPCGHTGKAAILYSKWARDVCGFHMLNSKQCESAYHSHCHSH